MIAALKDDPSRNRGIFVTDEPTKIACLINNRAEVSVFLRKRVVGHLRKYEYELYVANSTRIATYGAIAVDLDLGLRRSFKWRMIIADSDTPNIRMDFLVYNGLLIDPKNKRLIDLETGLTTQGLLASGKHISIKTIVGSTNYHRILSEFLDVTRPAVFGKEPVKHDVNHISRVL